MQWPQPSIQTSTSLYYNTLANSLWLGFIQIDRGGARNDSPEIHLISTGQTLLTTGQISFFSFGLHCLHDTKLGKGTNRPISQCVQERM
eukprot:scaffold1564_cov78-Skeletonema_dohrnii-CCMP3373.AAC.1